MRIEPGHVEFEERREGAFRKVVAPPSRSARNWLRALLRHGLVAIIHRSMENSATLRWSGFMLSLAGGSLY